MSTLDHLRKEAKHWLKEVRNNNPGPCERLRRAYPGAPSNPSLRDIQHALARERGATSWMDLKSKLTSSGRTELSPRETAIRDLLVAADRGDAAAVAAVLDKHPDVASERGTLPGHTGLRSALHFGVRHEAVVRTLLERGADPNVRDEGDNATALHFAAEREDLPVIRMLIEHGADPIGDGDGHELQVIGWATCFGKARKDVADYLLAHGARHTMCSAVATGDVAAISDIAARSPADLDRPMDRTNHRRRPLHLAVTKKQPASVATLLELGADVDAADAAGLTPLDQAALDGETALAQALIDGGASVHLPAAIALNRSDDITRLLGKNPAALKPGHRFQRLLVRASAQAPGRVIEALIRAGADVNVPDTTETSVDSTEHYTPLHAAAFHGNRDAVAVLLNHGADPTIRDSRYCGTPAGWANYAGHRDVCLQILEGPVDPFDAITLDAAHRIPAILERDPAALNRPFRAYAHCKSQPNQWWPEPDMTPLAWALARKKEDDARMLIERGAKAAGGEDSDGRAERVARFLRFACWDHRVHGKGDHAMYDRAAQRLLAQHPELARDSIYTAVVSGDLDEVRRILRENPAEARRRGGSRGWTPLLYLCYTRLSHGPSIQNAAAIAQLLLDQGANPNDYYMAGDALYSALVGVAGEGEQDSPRQPNAEALFQLLLDRGAEPFDIQVLYNTHFSGDMIWWLDLVYSHTVKTRQDAWKDPTWSMLGMGGYGPGAYYVLRVALDRNNLDLAEWALSRGARPDVTSYEHPKFKPRHTLYAEAVLRGRKDMAELLLRYGASPVEPVLDDEELFVAACLQFDQERIRTAVAEHPEYLRSTKAMFAVVAEDRADVVAFLLDLGAPVDLEDANKQRLLHAAAGHNALRVARLLVERGAEIDPRDAQWNGTPIGWAAYANKVEMVEFLSRYSKNVWTLTFRGYVARLREVLRVEPDLATAVTKDGITPLWWLPDDESKALASAQLLLAAGADPSLKSKEGKTAADWALERGMLEVARVLTAR